MYIYIYVRRPLPWPRQGWRLGPPQVWNLSFLARGIPRPHQWHMIFLMPKKMFFGAEKIDCSPLLCTRALTGDVCKSDCWSVSPLRRGSGAVNCDASLLLLRIGAASGTTCWNSCRAHQVVRHSQPVLIFVRQDSSDAMRLFHELPHLFTVEARHGFKHAGAQGSMSAAVADSLAHIIDIQKSQRCAIRKIPAAPASFCSSIWVQVLGAIRSCIWIAACLLRWSDFSEFETGLGLYNYQ